MFQRTALFLIVIAVALPAAAGYDTGRELLDAMLDAERKRAEGVSDYAMDVTLMGQPSTLYYERTEMEAVDGRSLQLFRPVPLAGGKRSGLLQETADNDYAAMIAERAEIVGRESIDGRNAYLVRADGLNFAQKSDGREFVIQSIQMWVDAEDLVMLKTRMDGVTKQSGQSREMYIEKLDQDYRSVPESGLILPYRSVMRMDGMLSPKEQKEMEKSRSQLAEFDQQMASMPPDQQKMMQNMMGSKIEMMRKMVEGGTFEFETIVHEVRVNQGIEAAMSSVAPGASPMGGMRDLVKQAGGMATAELDAQEQQQAREACLQRKIAEAEAKKKKKKRFGKVFRAVGRVAGRHATGGLAGDITAVSSSVYEAGATTRDLKEVAEGLGISQDDIAACENAKVSQ